MAGMSVDGLVSGLDTTSLVSQLMQVEAIGQTQLKARVSANDSMLTALRSLNTRVTAMSTAAAELTKATTWSAASTTVTGSAVQATTTGTAEPGSWTVDVTSVARAHAVHSTGTATDVDADLVPAPSGAVTVNGQTLHPANGSLRALVTAINQAEGLGVTARAVQTGVNEYRLQVVSTTPGASSAFTVGGLDTEVGVQGSDTVATVNGLRVTSSTATLTDVVPGVTLAVRAEGAATVDVSHDPGKIADAVGALVSAANVALGEISAKTAWNATTKTGGALTGNAAARALSQSVLSAVSGAGTGALTGVQTTRDGSLVFDRAAFLAAYAADPAGVRAAVAPDGGTGLAQRLTAVADAAVGTTVGSEGSLVRAVQGVETRSKDLTRQIEAWDVRLEMRRTTLQRQFSGLEVALNKLQSQSQWLSGQLASLSSSGA